MVSPRWRKLGRDLWSEKGRVLLMIAAIVTSLVAVTAVLGAYAILTREMAVNYLGTRPASATLEVEGGADGELVAAVREHPAVAEAEVREVVAARTRVGASLRPLLLFVIDDFHDLRLNTFRSDGGIWPPPDGTMLIERSSVAMVEAGPGQSLLVTAPGGSPRELPIVGLVHDPGLAPAWQERLGYGYITRATLGALGGGRELGELRIEVRDRAFDTRAIEAQAAEVARWLAERGHAVREIRVPPPQQHPHQRQMTTILLLLLSFSAMALVLSAIMVATSLAAMLARQVREIGVMKAIGARSTQIAGLYLVLVGAMGATAVLLAWPAGVAAARAVSDVIATMLNFTLTSVALPGWVLAVVGAAGVLVPILCAAIPIGSASRITVRQAIDRHGVSAGALRPGWSALPTPLRNAVRRPARLALTLGLLAAGGAMFMTALNVSRSWELNLAKIPQTRHYDIEIKLHAPQSIALAERLRGLPGVRVVEPWGYAPTAFSRPGEVDVVRTYPDRGHGSLAVLAPPPSTKLIDYPLRAGRWLEPGDSNAVVLNHAALAQVGAAPVGGSVALSIDGRPTTWRVVGVVEEIGSPGIAYITDEAFMRAAGTSGRARMLRIVTDRQAPQARTELLHAVEQSLAAAGASVDSVQPLSELGAAVGDHVIVFIRMLLAMAVVMAVVGVLGLGSTLAIGVVERTRELGVMKAMGATPRRLVRMIVAEALWISASSWVLALVLCIPLTVLVDTLIGNLGFLAPLPFALAPGAIAAWLALVGLASLAATLLPARRAARLTVHQALTAP
jgi:putative ABC transport system permease protein